MKAIVLAGGSGTRLWPLSRENYPKQFLRFNSKYSLFQQTILRLLKYFNPNDFIILTNKEYKFHIKSNLDEIDSALSQHILLEPVKRNTAPAIALAVKYCLEKLNVSENEILFVFPSDHIIKPEELFIKCLEKAKEVAKKGYLITFGIKPTRPETGYGYIKTGRKINEYCYKVEKFIEKPDLKTAKEYFKKGNYYWNAGIFVFDIKNIMKEYKNHAEDIFPIITKNSYEEVIKNFEKMPDISIDYAIIEKSKNVATIPLKIYWNDIGSWDSLFELFKKDEENNVSYGDVITLETKESFILGNNRLIALIGLENMLVIETDDAILIAKRGKAQKVKTLVELLKKQNRKEVIEHRTIYKPWGSYTVLEEGPRYKIKKIVVNPGKKLSLQMHYHRSEHWVVVRGTAKIRIGDKEIFLHENESAYVPKSTLHRLENPGKIPLEIIEVQNGEYVEEDDIMRFEDEYGRE